MRNVTVRIVRDDGLGDSNPSFLLGSGRWHIEKGGLEGYDGLDSEVSSDAYAVYDGSYLLGERSGNKDRTITAFYTGPQQEGRSEAESFFRAGYRYDVHVDTGQVRRWFSCRQCAMALPISPDSGFQQLMWTCIALDPYFLSEDSRSFNMAEAKRKFGFPYCSFAQRWAPTPEATNEAAADTVYGKNGVAQPAHIKGMVFGVISRNIAMDIGGNAPTFPRFDIKATGDVTTPQVTVKDAAGATVCSFGLAVTMKAGDVLVVDFATHPTTFQLNGADVSQRATAGSTLTCALNPGRSHVSWSAAGGDASMGLVPTIRDRFSTV